MAGVPIGAGALRGTVSTTGCRTSIFRLVRPGIIRWEGKSVSPNRSAPLSPLRWVPRAAIAVAVILTTAGCQSSAFNRLGFPPPVTKQGQVTLTLWRGSWVAAWIVGAVVWGLILWAVFFHRKRSDRVPDQVRYNLPIEALYTVLPFIMVGVLFFFTVRDENFIDKLPPKPDVVVNVTGFQWSWEFQYPQYKVHSEAGYVTDLGQQWNGVVPGNKKQLPVLEIPHRRDGQVQPHLDRRHPRILDRAVRVQARRDS